MSAVASPTVTPVAQPKLAARQFALLAALGLTWLAFTMFSGGDFLKSRNMGQLAIELSCTAVVALGMLLIMVVGHIDLAVGSGIGLAGGIAAVLIAQHGVPAPLAMLIALAIAVALWTLMGWIIARERIPAFIITLAGLLVFKGVFWKVIGSSTVPVRQGGEDNLLSVLTSATLPGWVAWTSAALALAALAWGTRRSRASRMRYGLPVEAVEIGILRLIVIAQVLALVILVLGQARGVPIPLVVLAVAAFITWVITTHTRFGRWLYACGSNEQAAALSGVPVRRITILAFAACGIAVAITGFLQTAYIGNSTTTVGDLMELDAIAACVIGGVSVKGGRGTVAGVIIGALLIATLMNGLTLMAVSPEFKFIARGLVLALAVWMDVRLNKRR
ncbi:MAG: ATPase [Phycisphaerae bacterium]